MHETDFLWYPTCDEHFRGRTSKRRLRFIRRVETFAARREVCRSASKLPVCR